MKKILFFVVLLVLFCTPVYSSVTTTSGNFTLDFYEDMLSGIENRWIFEFTVNDPDGQGGIEDLFFDITFYNIAINFANAFNIENQFYAFSYLDPHYPVISSNQLPTPVNTTYLFYATPLLAVVLDDKLWPVMGTFGIRLEDETVMINGPVDFTTVPEPACCLLFVFGSYFLYRSFLKKK
jgi:hypothetical protein